MPKPSEKQPGNWTLPLVLLGIYLLLKLQGWNYGFRAADLERQLEQLRPTLSAIVLSEQLESAKAGLTQVCEKVGRLDIQGSQFLEQLSRTVPVEITLEKIEMGAQELQIHGVLKPGARPAEEVLALWMKQWKGNGHPVQVQELTPDRQTPEIWRFQLKSKESPDVS